MSVSLCFLNKLVHENFLTWLEWNYHENETYIDKRYQEGKGSLLILGSTDQSSSYDEFVQYFDEKVFGW